MNAGKKKMQENDTFENWALKQISAPTDKVPSKEKMSLEDYAKKEGVIQTESEPAEKDYYRGLAKAESIGPERPAKITEGRYWKPIPGKLLEGLGGFSDLIMDRLNSLATEPTKDVIKPGLETVKHPVKMITENIAIPMAKDFASDVTHPIRELRDDPWGFVNNLLLAAGGTAGALKLGKGALARRAATKASTLEEFAAREGVIKPPIKTPSVPANKNIELNKTPTIEPEIEYIEPTEAGMEHAGLGVSPEAAKRSKVIDYYYLDKRNQKLSIPDSSQGAVDRAPGPHEIKILHNKITGKTEINDVGAEVGDYRPDLSTLNIPKTPQITSPEAAGAKIAEGGATTLPVSPDILKNAAKQAAAEGMQKEVYSGGLNIGQTMKMAKEKIVTPFLNQFHSPEVPLRKHPSGQKIYDVTNMADLRKVAFQEREYEKFATASKEVNSTKWRGIDTGVFKVLDNKLNIDDVIKSDFNSLKRYGITQDEIATMKQNPMLAKKWHGFLNEGYNYLLRQWGKSAVGPERESQLWKMANEIQDSGIKGKPLSGITAGPRSHKPSIVQGEYVPTKVQGPMTAAEKEVFDIYGRRIKDYVTHVFNKDEMLKYLRDQLGDIQTKLSMTAPGSKWYKSLSGDEIEIKNTIKSFEGGAPMLMSKLPAKLRFKFFERRTGAGGYETSSVKAYKTYLSGISRKIFDDPALRIAKEELVKLPEAMRPYAEQYLKKWMGLDREPLSNVLNTIKSFEWTRTLGLNPRSAIQNWTQKINTFADAGIQDSAHGYRLSFNKEYKDLFDKSGLRSQIPTELLEMHKQQNPLGVSGSTSAMETIRNLSGFMFSKAEEGNLRHAFSTYYSKALKSGKSADEAMTAAIKGAQKTQFRYGRVGTPLALRGAGGVLFQFWSYPIKQMEFLCTIAKENPAKLIRWWALSEGTKEAADKFLGIDLSSGLGLGVNYGDLIQMLRDIPSGDWKKVEFHGKMSVSQAGGGLMPFGLGPGIESIKKILGGKSPVLDRILGEIEPVVWKRAKEGVEAYKGGADTKGKYTIKSGQTGNALYKENLKDLATRTTVARPSVEKQEQRTVYERNLVDQMGDKILQQAADLYIEGKTKEALALTAKYKLRLTPMALKAAIERRDKIRSERTRTPKSRMAFEEHVKK
jgi:hypothetical protein